MTDDRSCNLRCGFTLLEATVSLAILSLVGLAALGAVQRDLDVASRSRIALESMALAEDRLEAVRLLTRNDLTSLPDSLVHGTFPPPLDAYRWTADVEPVNDAPGLHDVTVEVAWAGGNRRLRARLYRPLIAAEDPDQVIEPMSPRGSVR